MRRVRAAASRIARIVVAVLTGPTVTPSPPPVPAAGLTTESYRHLAADRTTLNFEGLIEDLQSQTRAGDVVLFHACCHNPTGVDPTTEQWRQLAGVIRQQRLLPLIDFAYQGFGRGLDEDAAGLQAILNENDEAIVCNSFSKNFGLYSERVGAISLVAADDAQAGAARYRESCGHADHQRERVGERRDGVLLEILGEGGLADDIGAQPGSFPGQ